MAAEKPAQAVGPGVNVQPTTERPGEAVKAEQASIGQVTHA
jgi:hypothetical protein